MHDPANASAAVCACVLALASCGDGPQPVAGVSTHDDAAIARIGWADGLWIRVLAIDPDPVAPGATLQLAIELEGSGAHELELAAWPPRVGGRELAIGSGVDHEDARRPDDDRVTRVPLRVEPGMHETTLTLPSPWHPRTAMLTLARADGTLAIHGPRTRDGLGIAGLVRVEPVPTHVAAIRTDTAPILDGVLDDAVWARAASTALLDSLDGEPLGPAARLQLAWDDTALYAAARLDDDDVWSDYQAQDDPLWKEEAFELFLLGKADRRRYLELQVSPRGITFDARFERYRQGDEAWDGEWQAAVVVDGTLARRDDRDRAWIVELAVPWTEICAHTETRCPARVGDELRINAFRLDRPRRGGALAQALSPTRVTDFHAPEHAAVVELSP